MLAYLVIREGAQWTDVFRLIPGQSVTIVRAPTNQIVDIHQQPLAVLGTGRRSFTKGEDQ